MKVLTDTNIVIDALTSRKPWTEHAEKIFLMAANNIVEMYITASTSFNNYLIVSLVYFPDSISQKSSA